MRLDINVSIANSCELIAVDNTTYEESDVNYTFVEFLCYYKYQDNESDLIAISQSKKTTAISNNYLDTIYKYNLQKDGRYRYYKYGIYNYNSPIIFNGTTYQITNKIFYKDGVIYRGISDTTTPIFDTSNSVIISNWYNLINYTASQIDYFYDEEIFTICHLQACLLKLQKQFICNCKGLFAKDGALCKDNKNSVAQRDFLLASIYVLNLLIANNDFFEAQRIVESLSTCGRLCDDNTGIFSTNGCNCK